ncbi:cadherin-like and PC-esterase domain-containing protein 1 isoform X2 [Cynoglossus semilaevis]|uniref:cadherin-like and PC-esterase domain-containing protein 1 isoform X2 n=1 Tax=Cynoglossus semilaevis TaxID=244447 RepID=UPI000495FF06|nr:cadherin-like and PC-esterase domain-containing protein 1 isoform X2 [Cynoglossus semilaevis]
MRGLLPSASGLLLMLLRRRSCSGPPLLLLLAIAVCCLFYQTVMVARNRLRSTTHPAAELQGWKQSRDVMMEETRRLISDLEAAHRKRDAQSWSQKTPHRRQRRRAVVLSGQHQVSDTQVQVYQQVLEQLDYEVHMSTYAETSSVLRPQQGSGWNLLLCLSSAEHSCLRRMSFLHLQRHQRVNLIPELMDAFSDVGGGLCLLFARLHLTDLPMRPFSCASSNERLPFTDDRAPPPGLVAIINVYVLVTSLQPLTSFLHDIIVVTTNHEARGRPTKLSHFLPQQLGPENSHQVLKQIKKVIGEVLQKVATDDKKRQTDRCVKCYQLLTFTLLFTGSIFPEIIQVDTDLTFDSLKDETFEAEINRDLILEDTLNFLPRSEPHLSSETETETKGGQYISCTDSLPVCLSDDDFLLLLQFHRQMTAASSFHLLYPSTTCSSPTSSSPSSLSDLLVRVSCYYNNQRGFNSRTDENNSSTNQESALSPQGGASGLCADPHLRQIYTHPGLSLTPPFSRLVKEYRAEVTFDTVTIRIRPVPVSSGCQVHLDEHRGPRMVNYPLGLGSSRINILVTDDSDPEPEVLTVYTVHVSRENRPSLPMFSDHVTCSFLQDCGLLVRPNQSCGLQSHVPSPGPRQSCSSGHEPGRWIVPCLSCSDNRTCDWREVSWQPDSCYHPLVDRPLLQDCMKDRKLLFIGDSTNRGMMYFLMERVNVSLVDWGKAHDTLVYHNLNNGRTQVSYSYYPQFWLEKGRRPTFRQALLQLLHRSRPLVDSHQTVLVVGGVQWLNVDHLKTVRDVLDRESLRNILVVVKSLGMGFHLPVDGIRSLNLKEIQDLDTHNSNIIATAKHHGHEVIDTFSITMGRYKEFLQGRCACHFHEVEKFESPANSWFNFTGPGLDQRAEPENFSYHVRGPVNQVYSEVLLSRLCPRTRT